MADQARAMAEQEKMMDTVLRYEMQSNSGPAHAGALRDLRVLVIPSAEAKSETMAATAEDMQVMSHILRKTADGSIASPWRHLVAFQDFGSILSSRDVGTQAVYIEDFGVLFMMTVDFPLVPPAAPQEQPKTEKAEPVDPTWEQARQAIRRPGMTPAPATPPTVDMVVVIETLEREMTAALRHASNMRQLKEDEWVIVVLSGPRTTHGGGMVMMGTAMQPWPADPMMGVYGGGYNAGPEGGGWGTGGGMGGYGGGMGGYGGMGMVGGMAIGDAPAAPAATVMTFRVRKSDVDAFASGRTNEEQFKAKVQILTY